MSSIIILTLFGLLATLFVATFAKDINSLYQQWKIKKKIKKAIRDTEKAAKKAREINEFCEEPSRAFKGIDTAESQRDNIKNTVETIEDDIPLISQPYKCFTRLNEAKSDEEVFSEVEQVIKKFEL